MAQLPKDFLNRLKSVKAKRPATIIAHILKHGSINSEEIKEIYGYNHPPRAIRDVREQGIPIETFRVKGKDGRNIAAYRFGDPYRKEDNIAKISGRTALSKALKKSLIDIYMAQNASYISKILMNGYFKLTIAFHMKLEEKIARTSMRICYLAHLQIELNHGHASIA